jgi:hypothetical protein
MLELRLETWWYMVGGGVKGEFSYPLLPYLSKKVVSPPGYATDQWPHYLVYSCIETSTAACRYYNLIPNEYS